MTAAKGLDLFAGARGWDVAARQLGWDMDGVEIMDEANATAEAEGFTTVAKDVRTFSTQPGEYVLGLGSPSCKRFSMAGNGAGRRAQDQVLRVVRSYATPSPISSELAVELIGDEDAALVVEPLRIFLECKPTFIALEQTPAALPIWGAYAEVLEGAGYRVTTGILNAERFGVPQTRSRAVLLARNDGPAARMPTPTHSRYYPNDPYRLDAGVKPWVTIGQALIWPDSAQVVSNYGTGGDPAKRGVRRSDQPSAVVTSKADRMKVHLRPSLLPNATVRAGDLPAPTILGGRKNHNDRAWVVGGEPVRSLSEAEAAALQTFPPGYRFQGTKTRRMEQIGNAVPPVLAHAILATFGRRGQGLLVTGSKPSGGDV